MELIPVYIYCYISFCELVAVILKQLYAASPLSHYNFFWTDPNVLWSNVKFDFIWKKILYCALSHLNTLSLFIITFIYTVVYLFCKWLKYFPFVTTSTHWSNNRFLCPSVILNLDYGYVVPKYLLATSFPPNPVNSWTTCNLSLYTVKYSL